MNARTNLAANRTSIAMASGVNMPAAGTMAVITVDVAGDRAADAVDAPVVVAADRDAREKQGLGVRG